MFTNTYSKADGYTPGVKSAISGKRVTELREAAGFKTQGALASAAGLDPSKLSKLENDHPVNLTLKTLERLAAAMKVSVGELFTSPRPEGLSGHDAGTAAAERGRDPRLDTLIAQLDADYPAEDSIEGDIHQALAALTRALRRPRAAAEPDRAAAKARR